ncbi:MAG: efflux RND transporter periplasmic adaptor subunit [Pseudomonadales bacterium]|nr:efflux RND transporter periplasmic adaptor subunit [Pseudomonadales bacterium]
MAHSKQIEKANSKGRPLWLWLSLAVFTATLFYLMSAEDTADIANTTDTPLAPLVSTEWVSKQATTIEIKSQGEITPLWVVEIRAAVSGKVMEVTSRALAGENVSAEELLIKLDDTAYIAEVASAEMNLKDAILSMRKAESATKVARNQFRKDGIKPPNDMSLYLPELEIAKSAVKVAKTRLAVAKKQLNDTLITAPFEGYVTERAVSLGQMISIGDPLLRLVNSKTLELTVSLDAKRWQLLQHPIAGSSATIFNQFNEPVAEAKVRQAGGFLDQTTRQYKIFLKLSNASQQGILSGEFVQVQLTGKTLDNTLSVPASAITQEGHLWLVDSQGRLQRRSPTIISQQDDRAIINNFEGSDRWQIATIPLMSFLPGQQVRTQASE